MARVGIASEATEEMVFERTGESSEARVDLPQHRIHAVARSRPDAPRFPQGLNRGDEAGAAGRKVQLRAGDFPGLPRRPFLAIQGR